MFIKNIIFLSEIFIMISSATIITVAGIYGKEGSSLGLLLFGSSAFFTYLAGMLSTRNPGANYLYLVHYDLHPNIIKFRYLQNIKLKQEQNMNKLDEIV